MDLQIQPCLWFDTEAEEAARFYTGIFKDSRMGMIANYPDVGKDVTGKDAGSVMTVEFELAGQPYLALNGGPAFKFNEAVSFMIICDDQAEVDYYWDKLSAGGDPSAQQCGWLKDRFGLSWQVVPRGWDELYRDPDKGRVERAFAAMMQMKKLDLPALLKAADGA